MAILEEETFKKFGYYPHDLKPQSHKAILAACDDCDKKRETSNHDYSPLCKSCVKKGKKHPNWKGGLLLRICLECGVVFYEKPARVERGYGKYCSLSCVGKATRKHQKFPTHHTMPERIFKDICLRNILPFRYVGDGQLWIGEKGEKQLNPDFVEANGKKIVVEIFGDYWHSPLLNRNMKEHSTLMFRKKHYNRYKWHPIFIWETDLLRKDVETFVLHELRQHNIRV